MSGDQYNYFWLKVNRNLMTALKSPSSFRSLLYHRYMYGFLGTGNIA